MLDKMTKDSFEPYVNQIFNLDLDGQGLVPLQLTSVVSHPAYSGYQRAAPEGATLRQEGFTLTFRGPTRPALPQRMYNLAHESIGKLDMIFLVPVGEDGHGRIYEAVFN
ncbi:MAG: hypothetical protein HND44_13220 [Chloroflexi bacterium]|nr:hypothetical protein [Ardenticatenaceae bacterium]MBL1129440.1 hypothetical protein [Chloroflexota bacterium]NOG35520.1 hypothetical protein [Chloroflexota bacterium]GIK55729.1 MAG: hypothetical protein BroJett015_13920 [Chloroflexota bacterium]